ncbi:glutaredoxin 3 [Marchantia polymorpha subsp. ruderalis]|uniref:Glutaredoxin domain-containing protein n=2 Tax=Marchantia polymorpha TaxID=3197 RepID=A0AAF6BRK9_MARPO|nr:hypothetical protein MARPO_0059s0028 [Marchantia polymorpha]BBN14643.1 hypothetical protein Mp_6g13210 [Marchantia polymorpha subsp. ruderalis]|eukprot:PTQ37076.1 hypothetical protein MARPO_0059s0028 [Marchantia polymorpha]
MQSPHPQSLQWGAQLSATASQVPDQITRQLMPPPAAISFSDAAAGKGASAYPTKNGAVYTEPVVARHVGTYNTAEVWDSLERVASENAVVMFSISSCCVCHVVKRLFSSLGVAPAIYELDQESSGPEIVVALQRLAGASQALPAIFIGKKYIGGLEELISAHIGGFLVPQLKQAGALWL